VQSEITLLQSLYTAQIVTILKQESRAVARRPGDVTVTAVLFALRVRRQHSLQV